MLCRTPEQNGKAAEDGHADRRNLDVGVVGANEATDKLNARTATSEHHAKFACSDLNELNERRVEP